MSTGGNNVVPYFLTSLSSAALVKAPPSKAGEPTPSSGRVEKKRSVARKSTSSNSSQFKANKGPRSLVAEESFPGYLAGWEPPWLKNNRRQAGAQQKKTTSSGGE